MTFRSIAHLILHFAVPLGLALVFFRAHWRRAFSLMILTMIVDLDHLLANPIYDADRCSIGFHPLHTWPAIMVYAALFAYPRTRAIGLGLLTHMALDGGDCAWMKH